MNLLLYSAELRHVSSSFCLMHLVARQDFAEEQNLVARMVHQLRSDDPDEHFQILKTARRHFSSGGPRRVKHTLPPLAFSALQVLSLLHLVLLPATTETAIITLVNMPATYASAYSAPYCPLCRFKSWLFSTLFQHACCLRW